MSEKYKKLQQIYQSSDELNTGLEAKYQQNLEHQIDQYKNFLKVAKAHTQELDTRQEIVGLSIANDKIPFNFERGDTIGVSLANSTFSKQVEQSEEYINFLNNQNKELLKDIELKEDVDAKLDVYIEEINNRIESDQGPVNEIDELERKVQDEKTRYRKLRRILKELVQEYE